MTTPTIPSKSSPKAALPASADTVERTLPASIKPLTFDNLQWGVLFP